MALANSAELHVHAHRTPPGVTAAERALVLLFLRRYVLWCAKARHIDRLRNAVDLLAEVAAHRLGTPDGNVAVTAAKSREV